MTSYLHGRLNKIQYLGKVPPLDAADQEEKPEEDRHFPCPYRPDMKPAHCADAPGR